MAVITLTPKLTRMFPKLKAMADKMNELGISEMVTPEAFKTGQRMVADDFYKLETKNVISLNSFGYRQQLNNVSDIYKDKAVLAPSQILYLLLNI